MRVIATRLSRRGGIDRCGRLHPVGLIQPHGPWRPPPNPSRPGSQRLSLAQLRNWESLRYGMFIHFGMSTFVQNEIPDGKAPATIYAPDRLRRRPVGIRGPRRGHEVHRADDQARRRPLPLAEQAHRLHGGQQRQQDQRGRGSSARHASKRGVLPGFYYCSWDNHNRFGSKTPSDRSARGRE